MSTFLPANSKTSFVETSTVFPEDQSQLLIQLTSRDTTLAYAINIREIAQYETVELLNGQQFFTPGSAQAKRFGYRKVFLLPATVAGATTNIAHGLSGVTAYTHIYGCATTAVPDDRPIPYASATAVNQQIEVKILGTNIVVINGAAAPNITGGFIVLEYLKN
jgi:hypothetical protein